MSSNYAGISPKNPRDYTGPTLAYPSVVLRNRRPTGADFRQPESGKLYPISSYWILGVNPTNGVQGELWYLSKIVSNVAYWLMISGGVNPPIDSVLVQSVTAPGVNPVVPDVNGQMTISGSVVATHGVPLESHTRALNSFNLEVQIATTVSPTPVNSNSVGLSSFNANQFQIDATSGMVSLVGSTVNPPITKVKPQTGTDPVIADATGQLTFNGSTVVAGTNPVRTNGTGANTVALQVQLSQAIAGTDATKVGLSNFKSTEFSVDANGFVSLVAAGPFNNIVRQVFTANGTYTPTSGMKFCDVEVVGGGGGGGGSGATAAGTASGGAGGGGGGYAKKIIATATIGASKAVTIGAAGTAGAAGGAAGGNGGAGGTSSLGALISATGGDAGIGGTVRAINFVTASHSVGGVGSGGDINIYGTVGEGGFGFQTFGYGGNGGNSFYGAGAPVSGSSPGNAARSYGAGGGGGSSGNGGGGEVGSVGTSGIIVITEYIG